MANELTIVETDVLDAGEKNELNANIDNIIAAHKNNRQEINRLVFESVAAMTEADAAQNKLSNKGTISRFIGGITGSNQKLQNKINSNRAAAQYAAQQTLQKLAEQNLMTFDLITAVNNKLNASLYAVNEEFSNIYTGLGKFFRHNRNEMVRLETRLAKIEQNVQLLTWQNSIEYLEFDGEEYVDMDDTKKIVCLTRDFYDITKGKWTTSDLLLLKTAMATIGIQPKAKVNYFDVLKEIEYNEALKEKLFNGMEISPIEDPSYLIAMGTLQKMNSLNNEEAYIVDTVNSYMNEYGVETNTERICDDLTNKYMQESASVDINTDIESYDMILDLLYNLRQADDEQLLISQSDNLMLAEQEQQSAEELNKIGDMYYFGDGVEQDYTEAVKWYKKSAEQDYAEAQWNLGFMYEYGYGIEQNDVKAVKWYRKSTEHGYAAAQYKLGIVYQYGYGGVEQNDLEAVKWYSKSAEQGYAIAQHKLGVMYQYGNGIEQSDVEAVKWYKKSAEQGYADAQNDLGFMYEYGYGIEQNYIEAAKWYRKAAEQGSDIAQCNLGLMYEYGKGVEQNYTEAIEWYKKSAEQGFARAQYNLGIMYEYGQGVEQNYTEAIEWYKKSAEQGNGNAQCNLGWMYESGKGVIQDYSEAVKWYNLAAEQELARGQYCLGDMYENGKGVNKDYEKALRLYRAAAEQGNDWAQNSLGDMYYYGKGVRQNCDTAIKWYKQAANQGNEDAKESLEKLAVLLN